MPDSAAALAVLVLAWDEAAPAVLTVVEAAPSIGSLLVLLPPVAPAAPAPESPLSAAPLPARPTGRQAPALLPQPSPASSTADAPASPPAAQPVPTSTPTTAAQNFNTYITDNQSITDNPVVRRLHLVPGLVPPARERSGSLQVPAAPYLGATPANQEVPYTTDKQLFTASIASPVPASPLPPAASQRPGNEPDAAPAAPAPTPLLPEAPATVAAGSRPVASLPLAEAAFAADEILDPNPEDELYPAASAAAPAATPADSPALADPAPSSVFPSLGPFGNRLPQFDTSPQPARPPRPAPEPDPEELLEEQATTFAATVAVAHHYPAPDLNSQVINYARLAVPTALAAAPFGVIYAPAWPTWLAALELRQRTSRPLVLHLVALAAGRQPADTAAGWPAEIQRQVLRQADLVLVETYALSRRLRRELGLASVVVRVVPAHDAAAIARALRRARRRP